MTAGVAATRALFPLSGAISPSDAIMSSHTLSSPIGRAIAYNALYEGAHFSTAETTSVFKKGESTLFNIHSIDQLIDPHHRFSWKR